MNDRLVSIGIPTYNRSIGLEKTLSCITAQTYRNLEIIISDNSSDFKTRGIATAYIEKDNRIKYFKQENNIGATENFKFVLNNSCGYYFMWAADDDEWDPQYIESCIKHIGLAGSSMSNYKIRNLKTGNISFCNMPSLSMEKTKFENLLSFLENIQTALFYGLHKRQSIIIFLKEEMHDYYDCYFIIRQILIDGYNTYSGFLYSAGIDGDHYIPKPYKPKKRKFLEYWPFFRKSTRLILTSNALNRKEKTIVFFRLTTITLQFFIERERNFRPLQVNIMKVIFSLLVRFHKYYKIKR